MQVTSRAGQSARLARVQATLLRPMLVFLMPLVTMVHSYR